MPERKFKLAIAGELMVMRPFATAASPGLAAVAGLLRDADACYAHLEVLFGSAEDGMWAHRSGSKGSYMLADASIAQDLRWLGVDVVSAANNHSLDFGAAGIDSTARACRDAGIACAGIGRDLESAHAPAFVETPAGRVAVVAVSSGNLPHEQAGLPKEGMPGRPGINPLRVRTEYHVDHEGAEALRAIGDRLRIGRRPKGLDAYEGDISPEAVFQLIAAGGAPWLDPGLFIEGESFGVRTAAHSRDLERNLASIRHAAAFADHVIVAHHYNVAEGVRGNEPPTFSRDFAHRCVDAGATVYVGHGWHRTLGIEVYRGVPIVHGIGNFFAESQFVERVPADGYEAWGHDVDRLPTLTPAEEPLHGGLDKHSSEADTWWSSVVMRLNLEDGRARSLELHPVELDGDVVGGRGYPDGRPRVASGKKAAQILGRLEELSQPFGTDLRVSDGVGRVTF